MAFFERVKEGGHRTYFLSVLGVLLAFIAAFIWLRPRFAAQWTFFKRSSFLFVLGYVWYPYWSGDILHFYGLYLLLGSLVLGLRSRWLILMVIASLAAGLLLQYHYDFDNGWVGFEYISTEFWSLKGGLRNLFFNGWHPFFPWFAFLLGGMLIARLDLRKRRVQLAMIAIGATVFVAAEELAPMAQSTVDSQITSAYTQETTEPIGGAAVDTSKKKRPTLGAGINRGEHGDSIRAASRLIRALRREPMKGLDDTRPNGLTNFSATIELNSSAQPSCVLSAQVKPRTNIDRAVTGVASWVTEQLLAKPKPTPWGNDEGWPQGAKTVHLKIASDDRTKLREIIIPLQVAHDQVGWRRLRNALDTSSRKPSIFYIFSALGTSLIVIGASILACSFNVGERLRRPFVWAGQCALSLYVAHVLIGWTVIDLLNKSSGQTMAFMLTACVICWWIGISFMALWRSIFRRGPLEMLMRGIT